MAVGTSPPRQGSQRAVDPKYMTFVEHLQELRTRLIICVAAIALGSVVGWFLAPHALNLLRDPVCISLGKHHGCKLYVDSPQSAFTLNLKIAILIGFSIALPVTVYELWAFVAPAFGPGANRWAPIWMLSALVLFAAGAFTGYRVIPLALAFFAKFQGPIEILPFATPLLGFFILVMAVFGVSFELPLVLVSLSAAGIVSSRGLASKRLVAFFVIFGFSTLATPGADLISPLVLGAILYFLYELSIWVSKLIGR